MDAVANVVTAAFLYSNGMRRDTELLLLFVSDPQRTLRVRLDSTRLRNLNPDERSTAALVKNAIQRYWGVVAHNELEGIPLDPETETSPGIFVAREEAPRLLTEYASRPGTVWFTEGGGEFPPGLSRGPLRAILSDPYEFSEEERTLLEAAGPRRISLGPLPLHTAQCLAIVHNRLDTEKP